MFASRGITRPLLVSLTRDPALAHYDVVHVTKEVAHRPNRVAHRARRHTVVYDVIKVITCLKGVWKKICHLVYSVFAIFLLLKNITKIKIPLKIFFMFLMI